MATYAADTTGHVLGYGIPGVLALNAVVWMVVSRRRKGPVVATALAGALLGLVVLFGVAAHAGFEAGDGLYEFDEDVEGYLDGSALHWIGPTLAAVTAVVAVLAIAWATSRSRRGLPVWRRPGRLAGVLVSATVLLGGLQIALVHSLSRDTDAGSFEGRGIGIALWAWLGSIVGSVAAAAVARAPGLPVVPRAR